MRLCYLDASAWVKLYVEERGSDKIRALYQGSDSVACSSLGYVEVRAALARKGRGQGSLAALADLQRDVEGHWRGFLEIRFADEVVDRAARLAEAFALRGADAVHLSSAVEMAKRLPAAYEGALFVAADRELNAAADDVGLTVLNPEIQL